MKATIRKWTFGQLALTTFATIVLVFVALMWLADTLKPDSYVVLPLLIIAAWFRIAWIWFGRNRAD